jgi:hypothetical protein
MAWVPMTESEESIIELYRSGELQISVVELLLIALLQAKGSVIIRDSAPKAVPTLPVRSTINKLQALIADFHHIEAALETEGCDEDGWNALASVWDSGVNLIIEAIVSIIQIAPECATFTSEHELVISLDENNVLALFEEFEERPLRFKEQRQAARWLQGQDHRPEQANLMHELRQALNNGAAVPDFARKFFRLRIEKRLRNESDDAVESPTSDLEQREPGAEPWTDAVKLYGRSCSRLANKPNDRRLREDVRNIQYEILDLLRDEGAVLSEHEDCIRAPLKDGRKLAVRISIREKAPDHIRSGVAAWLRSRGATRRRLVDEVINAAINQEVPPPFMSRLIHIGVEIEDEPPG